MKYFIFGLILSSLLIACNNEPEPVKPDPKTDEHTQTASDDSNISIDFTTETAFPEDTMTGLLKELGLGMCNPNEKNQENHTLPPCSPKFFKFFTYKKGTPIANAFLLLVKARVHDFPLRRVFVFQREGDGKLVKVNGFVANLIGKRPSASGYDDLVLRFSDKDQNHFNCVYVWRNMHYEFGRVEQINDADIKAEYRDSMNRVIEKELLLNRMHF